MAVTIAVLIVAMFLIVIGVIVASVVLFIVIVRLAERTPSGEGALPGRLCRWRGAAAGGHSVALCGALGGPLGDGLWDFSRANWVYRGYIIKDYLWVIEASWIRGHF